MYARAKMLIPADEMMGLCEVERNPHTIEEIKIEPKASFQSRCFPLLPMPHDGGFCVDKTALDWPLTATFCSDAEQEFVQCGAMAATVGTGGTVDTDAAITRDIIDCNAGASADTNTPPLPPLQSLPCSMCPSRTRTAPPQLIEM